MRHINGSFRTGIYRISKKKWNCINIKNSILLSKTPTFMNIGYRAVITTKKKSSKKYITVSEDEYKQFNANDIIELNEKGIDFLWEYENNDNCFFLTESCSCNCIMCPQPPKKHNKELENKAIQILSLIPSSYKNDICVTGGEPTVLGDFYLNFMEKIRKKFPHNFLMTLTNGKSFACLDFLNRFHQLNLNSVLAISLCADTDDIHDSIVRVKGSFNLTQQGIYNLAKANEKIEIRIVISKLNYKRLSMMADFIYRNFPFIIHIDFMGMEYTGYASDNYSEIFINPQEYANNLSEAVLKLERYGLCVSVYNIPLCLLDSKIRKFAIRSISQWKQDYTEECSKCSYKNKCCGVFITSEKYQYKNISSLYL